jgi:hypothetical protein
MNTNGLNGSRQLVSRIPKLPFRLGHHCCGVVGPGLIPSTPGPRTGAYWEPAATGGRFLVPVLAVLPVVRRTASGGRCRDSGTRSEISGDASGFVCRNAGCKRRYLS